MSHSLRWATSFAFGNSGGRGDASPGQRSDGEVRPGQNLTGGTVRLLCFGCQTGRDDLVVYADYLNGQHFSVAFREGGDEWRI